MKLFVLSLLFFISSLAGHAQANSKDTLVQHINLDTLTVTAAAGPPVYRGTAARVWEITHTRIALSFDLKEKTARAKEWIQLHPYFYATDTLVLDAKSLRIDSVSLDSKKSKLPLDFVYKNDELKIHFARQYESKDTLQLYLAYTAMPYAAPTEGSAAITDDRGLYFINTDNSIPHKPAEIWTQGETEANSHWMITIDKPNSRFTTEIELTVPDSFVTLSNGALVKQVKNRSRTRTDIWRMNTPIQAYAVMFAVGKFSVIKDHWRNKEVSYYVEPEYAPYAREMFNHTPEMMDFFSQITGVPYPWNKYSQVVVRDYVSGAMENTTASLFGEFMNENARELADKNYEDVVSHELFHQWFGDYVTAASWSNLTVNESFANYGEELWRAHRYGKASADSLAFADLQGYIYSAQLNDPPLVRFNYDSREEMFDAISYNKGGEILRYLNHLVGDAAFDRAMKIYLTQNALHSADAQNWRMAVEQATGQDWNWFFNEWYYHGGHPILKVAYGYNDTTLKLTVTVSQVQSDSTLIYTLPLKTAVIYDNDKRIADWNITRKKEVYTYPYVNGKAPLIIPDCTHDLVGEVRDGKKPQQWLVQMRQADDFTSKRLAAGAAARQMSDSVSQEIIDIALADRLAGIRRYTLAQLRNASSDKYRRRWTFKVSSMSVSDPDRLVRAEAFNVLGDWKAGSAKQQMVAAVFDSSYAIAGAALDALVKIDKDTAYLFAKRLAGTHPRAALESAVWYAIAKKAADEDAVLFEEQGPYISGAAKFYFASNLNVYLRNVKSDSSFGRGIDTYVALILNESLKNYHTVVGGYLFQLASEINSNAKSDNKEEAESAKRRLPVIKGGIERLIAAEKDPEIIKDVKKRMKEAFE